MKLKKGDTVEVITGKDKGKQGEIAFVFPKTNKVIVNGINVASKHQKARRANEPGGIIEKDLPIHAAAHPGRRSADDADAAEAASADEAAEEAV